MKFLLSTLITAVLFFQVKAGDIDYAVSKIPAELLKNANAVKRYEEIRFEVIELNKARYYEKVAYTILNEKGDRFATCSKSYDQLQSVESIEGRLFDETGKKIRTLKKSEIQDFSGTDDNTLADDNRFKFHSFYYKVYPYTVEYELEVKYNYTMFYPGWIPQENQEHLSVEYSKASVVLPEGINFRYKTFNVAKDPTITTVKNEKVYSWEVSKVEAVELEYASPSWYELTPVVCMAPVQFAIQGYKGDMSSWQDFGKFVFALKAGRDELPDNIKQKVHELADPLSDPKEKISVLYDFLQKNSRYISIQLGVGGWQPFDAKYVAGNRYGDCKALTNYMYSLLKEAGIKSCYTLVKSGENSRFFMKDFPSSQFDHVILSVPLTKDTVWLECTSQTLPAGYLSGFTSDRYALVVDETGGTLVTTPRYRMTDNLQVRRINAELDMEGQLSTDVVTLYKARQQDNIHSLINHYSKEKVMEYLKEEIDLPNYDVVSFDYKKETSSLPSITERLKVTANNYAQVSGKRLFVSPDILSKAHRKLPPNEKRKYEIDLGFEYVDIDTVEIKVPAGYQPEAVPQDMRLTSIFGKYSCSVKVLPEKILYFRSMEQYSGRFPAKDYNDTVNFYEQIYKADRSKVVLVKKE